MRVLRTLLLAIAVAGMFSCSTYKRYHTVTQGRTAEKNFTAEFPFEDDGGLIKIKVAIDGNDYDFMFDSGNDLTMVDEQLLPYIGYKSNNVSGEIVGSSQRAKINRYITVDEFDIGGVKFEKTGAFSGDMTSLNEALGCGKFHGIIGSNLMRKAKWQIDYKNKVIRVTGHKGELPQSPNGITLKMKAKSYGGAKGLVKMGHVETEFTFDTGFNGDFSANKAVFDAISEREAIPYAVSDGQSNFSVYGANISRDYYARIPTFEIGPVELKDQIIQFGSKSVNLIGNGFFEHFIVTFDWKAKTLRLDPVADFGREELNGYPYFFGPNYKNNSIEILGSWEGHTGDEKIPFGAKFISINGHNVRNLTTQELCNFWNTKASEILSDKIDAVILVNGQEKAITLRRRSLLPKD
ncbi:hypothetical protein FUAX_34250 [Fulvitalea axinellae]|uniref:Aspartyl protease n=1 Tax=Fulvitalea axinellae TaxID=1182444 RepID=A0AAU9CLB5_9BACT|nr:hypothetical protein FUAX_34250 [Fulvitalea axinellae]